jgi:hypothetical protein
MNKPEDDLVIVTLIASNLLGRTCEDWPTAVSQARHGLKVSRGVIAHEKEDEARVAEIWAHNAEVHGAPDWIGEKTFIDWLVKDLTKTKRADRRKAFATRWWARLVEAYPEAPALDDSRTWTHGTLAKWKDVFAYTCQQGRAEINRANRKPRRRTKAA